MSFIRPLILLAIFFGALFLLREPLRNIGSSNASSTGQVEPGGLLPGSNSDNASSTTDSVIGTGTASSSGSKPVSSVKPTGGGVISPAGQNIEAHNSALSITGIINETNKERAKKQLPALKQNLALNASAQKKLEDMFARQYFKHESPSGKTASNLIADEDYRYITIAENLALGNFGGDAQVVLAWMNSPGHRANILDPRFQEIGVAVGKGKFDGKEQWIAVQHFAKPLSSCPSPNSALKDQIQFHTNELSAREKELATMKKEIDVTPASDPAYQAKIEKYNNLVIEYNTRLESLKDELSRYNEQVRAFNTCAGSPTAKKGETQS